jgi:hypothetical protein
MPELFIPNFQSPQMTAVGDLGYDPIAHLSPIQLAQIQPFIDNAKLGFLAELHAEKTLQAFFREHQCLIPVRLSQAERQQYFFSDTKLEASAMDVLLQALRTEPIIQAYAQSRNLKIDLVKGAGFKVTVD